MVAGCQVGLWLQLQRQICFFLLTDQAQAIIHRLVDEKLEFIRDWRTSGQNFELLFSIASFPDRCIDIHDALVDVQVLQELCSVGFLSHVCCCVALALLILLHLAMD